MPVSDAQKKASTKYKERAIKRIPLDVPKDDYEDIKSHAELMNESVNGFIKRAIREAIERDRAGAPKTTDTV